MLCSMCLSSESQYKEKTWGLYLGSFRVQSSVGFQFVKRNRIETKAEKLCVQTVDVGFEAGNIYGTAMRSPHRRPFKTGCLDVVSKSEVTKLTIRAS